MAPFTVRLRACNLCTTLGGFPIPLLDVVDFNRVFDAFFMLEDLFCDDVSRKQFMFPWSENFGSSFPLWNTPFSSLLNIVLLSGPLSFGDLERSRLNSGLPDLLRAFLGPSLSLRSLLLLSVPDSECREDSSKLRRAFTAF
ncbi:hypothetical protein Tco_0470653 [Tanacetum coccineum]